MKFNNFSITIVLIFIYRICNCNEIMSPLYENTEECVEEDDILCTHMKNSFIIKMLKEIPKEIR